MAQKIYSVLSPVNRFVFSVLRQGHPTEECYVRRFLPPSVFEALVDTGILSKNNRGHWQTSGITLLPLYGLYLAVSLPPIYPTARNKKQPVYLGPDSLWLTQVIPARLNGMRVLDLCAGSGIQGLLCAARGARKVVALERAEEAVSMARFNACLNRLDEIVEVRQSDLYSALGADEKFDFFACNPPFMPVMEDVDFPICGTGGHDGTNLLRGIFAGLPEHLEEGATGVLFCHALGSADHIQFNQSFLDGLAKSQDLQCRAHITACAPLEKYVDNSLRPNLISTCPELTSEDREAKIRKWVDEIAALGGSGDLLYDQIIWIRRSSPGKLDNVLAFDRNLCDPLFRQVAESIA
ncbi:MAG: methyltransferase [Terracidiphilus sp.]